MEKLLESVALHITNECSHKCPPCYATKECQIKCEGDIETLKKIADELKKANVKEINLVGGNPAEYSKIQELVEYLYSLGFELPILSNTHDYKNTTLEKITPYVTSLESTIHADNANEHDMFCGSKGAYENVIHNLLHYSEIKNDSQMTGIVLNVMKHNYNKLYSIIESLLARKLSVDYVMIQRIGLYGRAEGKKSFVLTENELLEAYENIDKINSKLGIDIFPVDAFPYCKVPEKFHKYLSSCEWGYSLAGIDMHGNISRCAVAPNIKENYLGNILTDSIIDIWENSEILKKFRNLSYIDEECIDCNMLDKCHAGCPMSHGDCKLTSDSLVKVKK